LFSQLLKPGIKKLVNEIFVGVHYVLSQQEYDELLVEETVPRRFALEWDSLILPFKVCPAGSI
jgi:Conserved oligomeric Golgi complex subunit 4, C-terminal